MVLRKVRPLFQKAQEAIDWLNRVINESILGSALIRLLNTSSSNTQVPGGEYGSKGHRTEDVAAIRRHDPVITFAPTSPR